MRKILAISTYMLNNSVALYDLLAGHPSVWQQVLVTQRRAERAQYSESGDDRTTS